MEYSKLCTLVTILCSWLLMVSSQATNNQDPPKQSPCLQNLLPCEAYLTSESPPPSTCCAPLKEAIEDQKKCLCQLFSGQSFLIAMNVTKKQILAVPKACGIHVDVHGCEKLLVHGESKAPVPMTSPIAPAPSQAIGGPPPKSNSDTPHSSACRHFTSGFSLIGLLLAFAVSF